MNKQENHPITLFGSVVNIQYFILIKSVILADVILCKNNKLELALW